MRTVNTKQQAGYDAFLAATRTTLILSAFICDHMIKITSTIKRWTTIIGVMTFLHAVGKNSILDPKEIDWKTQIPALWHFFFFFTFWHYMVGWSRWWHSGTHHHHRMIPECIIKVEVHSLTWKYPLLLSPPTSKKK